MIFEKGKIMKKNIENLLTMSNFDSKTLNYLVNTIGTIYDELEHNKKL